MPSLSESTYELNNIEPHGHRELVHQQMTGLLKSVLRTDHFSVDSTDEFQIERLDGSQEGIFKVWATPVIPLLEAPETTEGDPLLAWSESLADKPLSLFESLERWRTFSAVADRRLQMIFDSMPMPEDPTEAVPELFARLSIAFAFAAPFYNIEALVVDNRSDRPDNPIDFAADGAGGGKLDTVAMMLPSALKDKITARSADWGDLSWEGISETVEQMRQDFLIGSDTSTAKQFRLLNQIAALAGVTPEVILYAANKLEFIPAQVGGKSGDMPEEDAIEAMEKLLSTNGHQLTTNVIAKNMNALIRFLNWTPVIKTNNNFQSRYATYDSVCATSISLIDLVSQQTDAIFNPEFAKEFREHLLPQLGELDANSAKGRFILGLLQDNMINPSLSEAIYSRIESLGQEVADGLVALEESEAVVPSSADMPAFLVGGKVTGLHRAADLLGPNLIVEGLVLTTEAVNSWLAQIEGVNELIGSLATATDINPKLLIAAEISQRIQKAEIPSVLREQLTVPFISSAVERIVLRSSAFDEDTDIIGPAPGIYDSVIDIDPGDTQAVDDGIRQVVASYFSDRAVSFRELKSLQQKPVIAVLAQEYMPSAGGSLFIVDSRVRLNIGPSPSHINDANEHQGVEVFSFLLGEDPRNHASQFLTNTQVAQLTWMAAKIESVFGPSDLEFVADTNSGDIKLLQMRSLVRPAKRATPKDLVKATSVEISDLAKLPSLSNEQPVNLHIAGSIDVEVFQGALFRLIVANRDRVASVTLAKPIPATCHFANILESLGISIEFQDEEK